MSYISQLFCTDDFWGSAFWSFFNDEWAQVPVKVSRMKTNIDWYANSAGLWDFYNFVQTQVWLYQKQSGRPIFIAINSKLSKTLVLTNPNQSAWKSFKNYLHHGSFDGLSFSYALRLDIKLFAFNVYFTYGSNFSLTFLLLYVAPPIHASFKSSTTLFLDLLPIINWSREPHRHCLELRPFSALTTAFKLLQGPEVQSL